MCCPQPLKEWSLADIQMDFFLGVNLTVVIPDGDPGEVLLVFQEIEISLVGSVAPAVIIEREDLLLRVLGSVD